MAIRIVINHRGVEALLKNPVFVQPRARRIAAKCGPGYEVETFVGKNRVRATIRTATEAAKVNEETNHTLLRAVTGEA